MKGYFSFALSLLTKVLLADIAGDRRTVDLTYISPHFSSLIPDGNIPREQGNGEFGSLLASESGEKRERKEERGGGRRRVAKAAREDDLCRLFVPFLLLLPLSALLLQLSNRSFLFLLSIARDVATSVRGRRLVLLRRKVGES